MDDSGYVYWSEMGGQSIGRANLAIDMPTVKEDFISPTATNYTTSEGVAVRQENFCVTCGHIYWVNRSIFDLGGSIGRANLDGTGVNSTFINLLTGYSADTPQAVAVDLPKGAAGRDLTGAVLHAERERDRGRSDPGSRTL